MELEYRVLTFIDIQNFSGKELLKHHSLMSKGKKNETVSVIHVKLSVLIRLVITVIYIYI